MCPENAKVLVIEDQDYYQNKIADVLGAAGHTVVLTARNFDEVFNIFSGTQLSDLGVNVATIDGRINMSSDEGSIIAARLRRRFPEIRRVGLTNGYPLENVHTNLHKTNLDQLGRIVTEL